MAGRFCDRCRSLLAPGSDRCPRCGPSSGGGAQLPCSGPRTVAESVPRPWEGTPVDRGGHPLFPYRPRPSQLEVVEAIGAALAEGKHIVMESGTGTGKTICSLVGALEHARERKKKVLYLTRTISQSDQVMKELRSISRRSKVTGLPLLGRRKSCLLLRTLEEYDDVPPHALSRICEERKQRTMARQKGGCPFYADYLAIGEIGFAQHCLGELPTADEFDRFCQKQGACPYEARKAILPLVDVIVVPYVHLLSKEIRSALFDRLKLTPDDFVLIVDEAHNLIDAARDQESFAIAMYDVESAESEAREIGNPRVMNGVDLETLCATLRSVIEEAAREQVPANSSEARLGRRFLEGRVRGELGLSDEELHSLCANLVDAGERFVEERLERGKEPVSATLRLGTLLESWLAAGDARFVKLISSDHNGKLVANCVEPEETTSFLAELKGAVHMSGTLQPLRQYADILGLPAGSELRTFPSPFPPENRLIVYPEDVNAGQREMRENPAMKGRIEKHIADLCNATSRNTMVFFRSYEMLRSMRGGIEEKVDRRLYWEESGSARRLASNIRAFKEEKDGVFFTVMGGKVAEGLDFPGQELDIAVVVGLPYPPPSLMLDELKSRYDRKYGPGKGWEYTSAAPAVRKVQQAVGRLIRTETDRGAAVILDNRVSRYREQLGARPSKDPVKDVVGFLGWNKRF